MTDMRKTDMREYIDHLAKCEGSVKHFYCDHKGLVTISIGYLVDSMAGSDLVGRRLARDLALRDDVQFFEHAIRASASDVMMDWQRVKEHGRRHPGLRASAYADVAKLRIDSASVDAITRGVLSQMLGALYRKRPFLLDLDERVAMAVLDARYNPAGIAIYGKLPALTDMWEAINPASADHDKNRAVELFASIWANRGGERYQERHGQRIKWMREGLEQTGNICVDSDGKATS